MTAPPGVRTMIDVPLRRFDPLLIAVTLPALGGAAAVWLTIRAFFARHAGAFSWRFADSCIWPVAVSVGVVAAIAGVRLLRAVPGRPTGWWILGVAVAFPVWLATSFVDAEWPKWTDVALVPAFRLLSVAALVTWPVGRAEQRHRDRVRRALVAYGAILVGTSVLATAQTDVGGFDGLPGPEWIWLLLSELGGLAIVALAPVALLVLAGQQRRRLPAVLRPTMQPLQWAFAVFALGDLWLYVADGLGRPLQGGWGSLTPLGTARAVIDYGRFGVVPALLVLSDRRRRTTRALPESAPSGRHEERSLDARLARILGDPTATIRLASTPGSSAAPADRRRVGIVGPDGAAVAELDLAAGRDVTIATLEAAVATVQLDLLASVRRAELDTAIGEVRALQRSVVTAQDSARHRLERDLHDGAQQDLVALTLDASLRARRDPDGSAAVVADRIDEVVARLRRTVTDAVTPAIAHGLAAGLQTLRASTPIPCRVTLLGDLPPTDPRAAGLWYVASEAVANALKHAGATELRIGFQVAAGEIRLEVSDNGAGGVERPPERLALRVAELGGEVTVASPTGAGTAIVVVLRASEPRS